MAKRYLTGIPYVSMKFEDRKMYQLLDTLLTKNSYDAIFIDYLNMYIYGSYIERKHRSRYRYFLLKDHNIEYQLFRQAAQSRSGLLKLILNKEWKDTKKYELAAVKKVILYLPLAITMQDTLGNITGKPIP